MLPVLDRLAGTVPPIRSGEFVALGTFARGGRRVDMLRVVCGEGGMDTAAMGGNDTRRSGGAERFVTKVALKRVGLS